MSIFTSLSFLALRQLVDGACAAVGVQQGGDAVVGFLVERFTDHSQRLAEAPDVDRVFASIPTSSPLVGADRLEIVVVLNWVTELREKLRQAGEPGKR